MTAPKGYYSLIQFCPDISRLEAVNVGLVLFCPDLKFLQARMAKGNQRAAKLVGRSGFDAAALDSAKRAMQRRFEVDAGAFGTFEDFQRFVDTRANVLKLSQPRPMKVFDPPAQLAELFKEQVGGRARFRDGQAVAPELEVVFRRLHSEGRARLNLPVEVPLIGRQLQIPYAFRNGVWNLVKPHRFSVHEGQAISAAMRLAIEGDLLHKHAIEGEETKQLIVVAAYEGGDQVEKLEQRVEGVLREYGVRTVAERQVTEFVKQVEETAH